MVSCRSRDTFVVIYCVRLQQTQVIPQAEPSGYQSKQLYFLCPLPPYMLCGLSPSCPIAFQSPAAMRRVLFGGKASPVEIKTSISHPLPWSIPPSSGQWLEDEGNGWEQGWDHFLQVALLLLPPLLLVPPELGRGEGTPGTGLVLLRSAWQALPQSVHWSMS